MKTFINVIGYLMAGWFCISSAIGAIIMMSLSVLEGFIGMALWLFVMFVLITYGEEN